MYNDEILEECAKEVHIDIATVRAVVEMLDKKGCQYVMMCNDFRRIKIELEALRWNLEAMKGNNQCS